MQITLTSRKLFLSLFSLIIFNFFINFKLQNAFDSNNNLIYQPKIKNNSFREPVGMQETNNSSQFQKEYMKANVQKKQISNKNTTQMKNANRRYDKLRSSSTINHDFQSSYGVAMKSDVYNTITSYKNMNTNSNLSQISMPISEQEQEKINALISKNDRLKIEILKIEKVLKEVQDSNKNSTKSQYGVKFPQIRSQVLDKQLQNAYKQINHYQYEIQKKKSQQYEGTFAQQVKKAERTLEERRKLAAKLRRQIQLIQRQSKQFVVLLKDNRSKIDFQNLAKRLNDQVKMYQQRLDQQDNKTRMFYQNQRKKKQHALKMQNQLKQAGFLKSDIQALRSKFLQMDPRQTSYRGSQKQIIQDRSIQAYKSLLNEIKLLKKVSRDNQRRMSKFQSQRQQFQEKNYQIRHKLIDTEKQLQKVLKEIQFLKNHIDPSKFKPKVKPNNSNQNNQSVTSGNGNNYYGNNTFNESQNSSKAFPNRDRSILKHHFQASQIGDVSKRSQKFNDRKLLGRKSAKIVEVEFYQNRMKILGFQVWYLIGEEKIQGSLILIKNQNQRRLQKKKFTLEKGDYFVAIQCVVNDRNIIVGLTLVSFMGSVAKAGNFDGNKKFIDLNPKQYPCCLYACIGRDGLQMVGTQRVQPQKVQNNQQ